MKIEGRAHIFGENVNTDDIIAAKYLDSQDEKFLGSKCMENIDSEFPRRVDPGDILVAGRNFGCGSSREHAPISIKGCGIALVIAESFARIFYRNAINIGLPILEISDTGKIHSGDRLSVDLNTGIIVNQDRGTEYRTQKFPRFLQEIIAQGGLVPWVSARKKGDE
ncbi:MAG: 3-isopropylmalate dehydratase small subunit [Candidatus Omnitrophica bacterium]|nr:3-isopropylmalate dehydratase small subunit [Candidatus Omnitrophota bacterium]